MKANNSAPSEVTDKQWTSLADQAFFRLKEVIDLAAVEDPKLLKAIEMSFDRVFGKLTDKTELSGPDGAAFTLKVDDEQLLRFLELHKKDK